MLRVGGRFGRVEPRRRVAAFVRGLLAGLPRVNCWTIAEHAGEAGPRGMQRLLSAAVWDEAGLRDDLRGYVLEHFADPGAVLVVDETGDVKRGTMTVSVQRQYTGTAGRTENAQVAVYLAYAAPAGCAFTGRPCTCPGPGRRTRTGTVPAGVPAGTVFATKPALAKEMITCALDAGAPAAWVTADEVYGQDPALRAELARRGLGYVLAIARHHLAVTGIGGRPVAELAKRLPAFLAVLAAAQPGGSRPRDDPLIPLTCHEIRRLLTGLWQQPPAPAAQLHWSRSPRSCTGRDSDASTRPPSGPATTPTNPGTHMITKFRWRIKRCRGMAQILVGGIRPPARCSSTWVCGRYERGLG